MAALDTLAGHLGVSADRLAAFSSYDESHIARLDTLITGAMASEDKAFDAGLEEALRVVPRPLRGAAKKILFGGGRG
jgi:hypothetical protein